MHACVLSVGGAQPGERPVLLSAGRLRLTVSPLPRSPGQRQSSSPPLCRDSKLRPSQAGTRALLCTVRLSAWTNWCDATAAATFLRCFCWPCYSCLPFPCTHPCLPSALLGDAERRDCAEQAGRARGTFAHISRPSWFLIRSQHHGLSLGPSPSTPLSERFSALSTLPATPLPPPSRSSRRSPFLHHQPELDGAASVRRCAALLWLPCCSQPHYATTRRLSSFFRSAAGGSAAALVLRPLPHRLPQAICGVVGGGQRLSWSTDTTGRRHSCHRQLQSRPPPTWRRSICGRRTSSASSTYPPCFGGGGCTCVCVCIACVCVSVCQCLCVCSPLLPEPARLSPA